MYVYIVHSPRSDTFKFGISTRPNSKRLDSYRTVYGVFDTHVVACNNAHEVEEALKERFATLRIPHMTGRLSELVPRGDNDRNLVEAVRIVYATRTLSRRLEYIEPVLGDQVEAPELTEAPGQHHAPDHLTKRSREAYDDSNVSEGDTGDKDTDMASASDEEGKKDQEMHRLLNIANVSPDAVRLADVAFRALNGSLQYSPRTKRWQGEHGAIDESDVHIAVVRAIIEAADAHDGDTRRISAAVGRRRLVADSIDILRMMLKGKAQPSATSKLHQFLTMDNDERGCQIIRKEGHVTWVQDLARAMEAVCGPHTFEMDIAALTSLGFSCNPHGKRPNVCKSCKQIFRRGCCANYSRDNKGNKHVVYNMIISCD